MPPSHLFKQNNRLYNIDICFQTGVGHMGNSGCLVLGGRKGWGAYYSNIFEYGQIQYLQILIFATFCLLKLLKARSKLGIGLRQIGWVR